MCLACHADRRRFLRMMAAGLSLPALAACDEVVSTLVPASEIEQLGVETWRRLAATKPATRDSGLQRAAEAVTGRLLRAAGEDPGAWEVRVFAEETVNAFALPGRKIGVFEGMLRLAGTADGLAAVLGHEIGHLQADHPAERVTADLARQWGLGLAAYLLEANDVAFAREIAALLGAGAEFGVVRPYGRSQEREADRLGVFLMARAGFDPRAAVQLWRRMERLAGKGPPAFLSTHPAPASRARDIEAIIPEALAARRG